MNEKNTEELGKAAHKLHGACCFCGVPNLQRTVAYLEHLTQKASSVDDLQSACDELIQSIDDVLLEYEYSYRTHMVV